MEIRVKESTIVRPAHGTPKHCVQVSELDLLMVSVHIANVYFYRRRPNDPSSDFFKADLVKEALSNVLVPFYPMAGRLRKNNDKNGIFEIQCNGEGVLFMEAETNCVIDDFGDFESNSELRKLVPSVDYTKDVSSYPLVVAQVTHFKCGGVCLGYGLHHTLTDATAGFYFIKAWAEMTRGVPINVPPPFMDPGLLNIGVPTSPKFHHMEYSPPPSMNASTDQNNNADDLKSNSSKPISSAILNVSVDQINKLKSKAHEVDRPTTVKFSTFEILVAHVWRCMCKARGLSDDQASKLVFPVNVRSRLNPPLPPGYIGNALFTGTSIALSGDIRSEPLHFTAERIHKSSMRMDDEYMKSALAYLKQQSDLTILKIGPDTIKCPNLLISNLFHMPVYDADFGWGRPMFFRPISTLYGVAHILRSPSNDGSLLYLVLNLETQHMQLFRELFYEIFVYPKY